MIKTIINKLDTLTSQLALMTLGEGKGLSAFLFHGVKENNAYLPSLFPQEDLTLRAFDELIESFLLLGYEFIGPEAIRDSSMLADSKYGLLTFDDGYFNNTWCLEILEKYKVPAVFFITTSLIQSGEKQWSDVIFHERTKKGFSEENAKKEIIRLIPERIDYIKDHITREFGLKSFIPQGDPDRPMNEKELRDFSRNPLVYIGNHTHKHEALKYLTAQEVSAELQESQQIIKEITGVAPDFIAYPYGRYSDQVIEIARQSGLGMGATTVPKKNHIPLPAESLMELKRFNPKAKEDKFNLENLRSPVQLKSSLIGMLHQLGLLN